MELGIARRRLQYEALDASCRKRIVMITWTPNTAICESDDLTGCRTAWVEWEGVAREFCPGCGRRATSGNVIINDSRTPNVRDLNDDRVLVVFFEEPE